MKYIPTTKMKQVVVKYFKAMYLLNNEVKLLIDRTAVTTFVILHNSGINYVYNIQHDMSLSVMFPTPKRINSIR